MSVIEQTLVPTGSVPLKFVPWPGSNLAMMMTGELLVGWLLTMTMLVIETMTMFVMWILRVFVMVPVNPMTPPGMPLVAGQLLVMTNRGDGGVLLQVVLALRAANTTPQIVLAVAVKVSGNGEQGLVGV